jgi:D-tyrosyl-tRNA(Tyr) deacylase
VIAVLQRVARAQVDVGSRTVGRIGRGLLVLACAVRGDGPDDADALARKIAEYRVFPDDAGKMNRSILETGGEVLVVSQFTLAATGEKGRRPSFDEAAAPQEGRALVDRLVEMLRQLGLAVATGEFGAEMQVELVNDGPCTFILERPQRRSGARAPKNLC